MSAEQAGGRLEAADGACMVLFMFLCFVKAWLSRIFMSFDTMGLSYGFGGLSPL
jgi:hypothetical protein